MLVIIWRRAVQDEDSIETLGVREGNKGFWEVMLRWTLPEISYLRFYPLSFQLRVQLAPIYI